jgi:GPH family glycoside/pentoside/hexuronide:cation symporter
VPLRTKLAFSSGTFHEATVTAAGITTLIFYNQVLGVSPSLCGVAFLIAAIVDAVSDPLMGALSDRLNTRWGRRHPFMQARGR